MRRVNGHGYRDFGFHIKNRNPHEVVICPGRRCCAKQFGGSCENGRNGLVYIVTCHFRYLRRQRLPLGKLFNYRYVSGDEIVPCGIGKTRKDEKNYRQRRSAWASACAAFPSSLVGRSAFHQSAGITRRQGVECDSTVGIRTRSAILTGDDFRGSMRALWSVRPPIDQTPPDSAHASQQSEKQTRVRPSGGQREAADGLLAMP